MYIYSNGKRASSQANHTLEIVVGSKKKESWVTFGGSGNCYGVDDRLLAQGHPTKLPGEDVHGTGAWASLQGEQRLLLGHHTALQDAAAYFPFHADRF